MPFFGEPKVIANECAGLNLLETLWTDIPQFGCWHPHASRGEQEGLAFSTFVPNALYQSEIATQIAFWMLQRARWLRQERWPHLSDKPVLEILQGRLNKGKSQQSHQQDPSNVNQFPQRDEDEDQPQKPPEWTEEEHQEALEEKKAWQKEREKRRLQAEGRLRRSSDFPPKTSR